MTWIDATILIAGLVALVYFVPVFMLPIGAVALAIAVMTIEERRRLARMAANRQGESICTFARSFDCRRVDTWVIRAVFEELQSCCGYGLRAMPLRASDKLEGDLRFDSEELEIVAEEIAYRAGRSLEDGSSNPYHGNIKTVSDLVMFFVHQPRRAA